MTRLFFENALLSEGWAANVVIETTAEGWISAVTPDAADTDADPHGSVAVPGVPNIHSHAFQRAMAGMAEVRGEGDDDFWTWRRAMYRFARAMTPADLAAVAAQLYGEMLEAGFTSVAEFHYLHHDPRGRPYGDIGAMSLALAEAAAASGIGITLLPVFYANNGFGGAAPAAEQQRFVTTPDAFARLHERVCGIARGLGREADAAVGVAPHSLRAVTPESLARVVDLCADGPIHIHIAEQTREVDECVAWSGARPVQWLLENAAVDGRWCLIHATHMSAEERRRLAASGAVAGLCPITEANLGDGIFDGVAFIADGGKLAIGSDSNIYVSVAGELRLLEYSQRLRDRGRNRLAGRPGSTGRSLYDRALAGGAMAAGRRVGRLAPGYRADIVSLDAGHPALLGRQGDGWLDGWLFAADNEVVSDVWAGARHVVRGGRHHARDETRRAFAQVLSRILEQ